MKGFDLSDKELKSLLQEDGIEEPSMSFNRSVLDKIEAYEKVKTQPVRAPKWLLVSMLLLFIAPAIYTLTQIDLNLGSYFNAIKLPSFGTGLSINTSYAWIGLLAIAIVMIAALFDRFLLKTSDTHR